MQRIAVNTRLLKHGKLEGIGWFTWQSLRRIVVQHPEVEFHFFFDAPPHADFAAFPNVVAHVLLPPARRIILYKLWFDYRVPKLLKKINADLFVSPDGFLSLRTKVPQLAVIHDLNFEHHPEWLPKAVAKFYRSRFPQFARKAKRIATVSSFSAKDIATCYGIPETKIDVVYNGVNEAFQVRSEEEKNAIREILTGGQPYFIYVGSLHPRKNIERLIEAFLRFKDEGHPHHLVLAGGAMWRHSSWKEGLKKSPHAAVVHELGRCSTERLAECLSAAEAMVFVPLFEGFGIPALEAFAAEVPLIASNSTSLPEVCGDAALLVDPINVQAICEAMKTMALSSAYRQDAVEKGRGQVKKFSWDRTAELLWGSIQKSMPNSNGEA